MAAPRIFWLCSHETLRYEEIPLFLEAGAEIIPSLGDAALLRFDSHYDNESHLLYPHWRKHCTIPTPVLEEMRHIDIIGKRGKLNRTEAELFNRWIDVMYIASFPDIVNNVMDWFRGYPLFRVFGHGDFTNYSRVMDFYKLDKNKFHQHSKYIWSPILASLDLPEDPRIVKNKLYLNAFVSPERLGSQWIGRRSQPYISTTISYMDGNHPARDIYDQFSRHFKDIPSLVLGKNAKSALTGANDNIAGYTDTITFHSKIACSRMFIYLGFHSNFHLHFTPIEAISMGVPVLFLERSGLAQEARDHGISNAALRSIGMYRDVHELSQAVKEAFHNFDFLENLTLNQSIIFGRVFSRTRALAAARSLVNRVQEYVVQNRKEPYKEPALMNVSPGTLFRKPTINRDLPKEQGQMARFSLETIRSLTGRPVYSDNGDFIARLAVPGVDSPGMLLAEYIGFMKPGLYAVSMYVKAFQPSSQSVGSFSMGTWIPNFVLYATHHIGSIGAGENLITLMVNVSPETAAATKELRFHWDGTHPIEISHLFIQKLS
ncbi:glycosyltransferase [Paenibacillus sp. S-38]|uniref:glycosyltransferase n=1 Tax=Paenibacillus sp. S-38 TaxID=3416710 RepID=UPI003CF3AB52